MTQAWTQKRSMKSLTRQQNIPKHSLFTDRRIFGWQIQSVGPQEPVSLHILQLHEGRTHNALWDNDYRPKCFQTWRRLISYPSEDNTAKSHPTTLNIKAILALTPTAHSSSPHLHTPLSETQSHLADGSFGAFVIPLSIHLKYKCDYLGEGIIWLALQ